MRHCFFPMKPFVCAAVATGVLAAPVYAGETYFNPEFNQGWVGSQTAGSSLNLDLGYSEGPWYIQAGPALATGGSTSEWGIAGKTGLSGQVNDSVNLYAEVSAAKFKDIDTGFGLKVGSKFVF